MKDEKLKALQDAAMAYGRVFGGRAHASALNTLAEAATNYYEANRSQEDPPLNGPIECP